MMMMMMMMIVMMMMTMKMIMMIMMMIVRMEMKKVMLSFGLRKRMYTYKNTCILSIVIFLIALKKKDDSHSILFAVKKP